MNEELVCVIRICVHEPVYLVANVTEADSELIYQILQLYQD